jgi:hypothetical protein
MVAGNERGYDENQGAKCTLASLNLFKTFRMKSCRSWTTEGFEDFGTFVDKRIIERFSTGAKYLPRWKVSLSPTG